jgi:type I restriction enzyme S subunit
MSSETATNTMNQDSTNGLVPKLRFPEFRGKEGWSIRRLGNFLTESRLAGSKGNVARKITVKLWGKGVFEKNEAIQGSANTQYYRRKTGQFIYSKLDFLNQAFGIIPETLDSFESTVDLPCFDIASGLNPTFLLEYVKRKEFYERLGETADGSRKARRIHPDVFLSFPVSLPSTNEQQKIADCLSSLDDLIAAQVRKVEVLKTHKKGLMQQLFPREGESQPRLRFPEFQEAGEWEARQLRQVVDLSSGGTPSKANPAFWNGSIPWVTAKDMKQLFLADSGDHISLEAVQSGARLVPRGTLLVLTRGMTLLKNIPICFLLHEMAFNQDVKAMHPKAGIDGLFLAWMLISNKQHLLKMVNVAGHGTGKLDTDKLISLQLAVPSPAEQQRIASCLSRLDALITSETQKLETFKAHKKGLMQQLFPSTEEVEA